MSTFWASCGDGVVRQADGMCSRSLRSTATEWVEFSVRATELGSVTRLVSTFPVVGAKTLTS